ncbi:MAG: ATP-binding protein [Gammaproteobacteria bacterium]|nr:ATP-binding protein [Gammaproteobacteria bacterium]
MIRLIPPKTKNSTTIIKNFTVKDALYVILNLSLVLIIYFSVIPKVLKLVLIIFIVIFLLTSLVTLEYERKTYLYYKAIFEYSLHRKRIPSQSFIESTGIKFMEDGLIESDNLSLKSKAIIINGIDFDILPEKIQDNIINEISIAFKTTKCGSIFKIDRPIELGGYINNNIKKASLFDKKISSNKDLKDRYSKRIEVLKNIDKTLTYLDSNKLCKAENYFFFIYDYSTEVLDIAIDKIKFIFSNVGIDVRIANQKDIIDFYSIFFNKKIDENFDFTLPSIKESFNKITLDDEEYKIASFEALPLSVSNAWAFELLSIPNTIARMHFNLEKDKNKVYKALNNSIVELKGRLIEKGITESKKMDLNSQIDSLELLLQQLKMDNEMLHTVTFLIKYKAKDSKLVEDVIKSNNIYMNHFFFRQLDAYISMLPFTTPTKSIEKYISKEIQSTTLASAFPFVSHLFLDKDGDYLGDNRYPVFFDIFDSWKKNHPSRTNANMCILGKSGGGKSFYLKKEIMQQICNGTKIFILDPENEYQSLSNSFLGNFIDMGGIKSGKINPFQVFPSLSDNLEETGELKAERQFLSEFLTIVMPDLDKEARPYLNQAIKKVYAKKHINDKTNFSSLKNTDYPTFDDLYKVIDDEFNSKNTYEFDKIYLRKIRNYLEDFREDGMYSNLWNGYTTLELKNDFTVLNFQSLFASNNTIIANGQMLLLMRFLMQEVIKNKRENELYNMNSNIQIVVDEAHQFINPDFPIALTFMSQMTKRIRKYGGSIIVATQNIKDFIGQNESTKAKATSVLNGCQYSLIFGLNPDDINSIIDLYRSYNGGLTEKEIESLSLQKQGEALLMVDSKTRINLKISLYDNELKYIENSND